MKRLLSLLVLLAAAKLSATAATTPAFPFTFYIHDTTGVAADTPLSSIYQFAATPLGSNSNVVLKAINSSSAVAFIGAVSVTTTPTSGVLNTNFTVGPGLQLGVPVGGSVLFTVNFSPTVTGVVTGYLQTSYQVQQSGCSFFSTNPATQCPSGLNIAATLSGTATQPQLVLSNLNSSGVSTIMQPTSTPLNFGNISTSATFSITFALSNQSSVPVKVPAIAVPSVATFFANPYLLNASQVPAILAAGATAHFTITFAPGQTGLAIANLLVGSNIYPLQGEGVVIASIDALQINYVDNTGVRSLPQAATPISFGQIVNGTSGSQVLTFTVTNPSTSFNSVTVPSISVSGTGFVLYSAITGAGTFPASVAPGGSLVFRVAFTPTATGTYSGLLSIGSRVFSLAGLSINSPLPSISLTVNPAPLASQQQATIAVQFASASSLNLVGTITLAFAPSMTGVSDDPAILFLANGARTLSISVASGTQSATYNGQSALSFQTGTTAGTITFAVSFPNTPTYTQSYTITPAIVQITSATAVRSNPNLVVTLAGYDNTYSAGQLSFTFYDTSGKAIAPVGVNAASNFQNLFFNSNQSGGAYSLQATFPVTGDVTSVSSVGVTITNSVGQTTTSLTFQ